MPVDNPQGSKARKARRTRRTSPIIYQGSLTAEQVRAARAILRIEQTTLAEKSGLSVETIKRIERQNGPLLATEATLTGIHRALEREGIEFLDETSGGPGVRIVTPEVQLDRLVQYMAEDFADFIKPELEAIFSAEPYFLQHYQEPDVAKYLKRAVADALKRHLADPDPKKTTAELRQAARLRVGVDRELEHGALRRPSRPPLRRPSLHFITRPPKFRE